MPKSVVQPVTPEIISLCEDADVLRKRYLAAVVTCSHAAPRFEARTEVYTILKLMFRHLEAICELARSDLVTLPAAIVLARAVLEASVRARWLLKPVDPYEQEVRWVLHLRTALEQCAKLEKNRYTPPSEVTLLTEKRCHYEEFDKTICDLLIQRGYSIPKQAPNVWEMLKDIDEPHLYRFYIRLSAFTHTNFEAGLLYKKNFGMVTLGEFITPFGWELPLSVGWKCFYLTARDFLICRNADLNLFDGNSLVTQFDRHLKALTDPPWLHPVTNVPNTSRNERCHCGSGKKFKRCCGKST